jgi:N-acetylneuraminic acid mutarotase
LEGAKQVTDAEGHVSVKLDKPGLIAIRARHIEAKAGKFEDKDYAEIRHYVTLTLPWESAAAPAASTTDAAAAPAATKLPQLPEGITSFGGATSGDFLYVYGGNTAAAHSYSYATQSPRFRRLNLKSPQAWEELAPGPRLQGTALVAVRGKLVRIGGFSAHNAEGEENNLWSVPDVAAYDPEAGTWTNLPPLPAPRSSHDAAVIGDTIYVVGGWQLRGTTKSEWHDSAWSLDLSAEKPTWKAVAVPGFKRRALSVAELDGKLYAIGGMQVNSKITNEVSIYDPATDKWSTAANLPGEGMEGFGTAAFSINKHLVVTTRSGKVWSLDPAANAWQANDSLKHPRFFHRVTPMSNVELVVFGGTSGDKVLELETVRLK